MWVVMGELPSKKQGLVDTRPAQGSCQLKNTLVFRTTVAHNSARWPSDLDI